MTIFNGVALVSLRDNGNEEVWLFPLFPRAFNKEDRSNWNAMDVTVGTKPLMFANHEPQRITIEEALLDTSDTNESVLGLVEGLRAHMKPDPNGKTASDRAVPPRLRFIYGDFQKTVVLEDLRVEETFFNREGNPTRARVSLSFLEFVSVERVIVKPVDPPAGLSPEELERWLRGEI